MWKQRVKRSIAEDRAPQTSALVKIVRDEKLLGLEDEDEAAYLSLMLVIGAADTVR